MAGKFVEKDGLLVLTWILGTHELDTGFRTRRAADKDGPPRLPSAIDRRSPRRPGSPEWKVRQ